MKLEQPDHNRARLLQAAAKMHNLRIKLVHIKDLPGSDKVAFGATLRMGQRTCTALILAPHWTVADRGWAALQLAIERGEFGPDRWVNICRECKAAWVAEVLTEVCPTCKEKSSCVPDSSTNSATPPATGG